MGTKAKVRFQIVTAERAEAQPGSKEDEQLPVAFIHDICSKFATVSLAPEQPKLLGCVADESWLGKYWRTQDIMFPDESQTPDRFNQPYIVRDIANGGKAPPGGNDRTYSHSPLIRNETLFSLGLILVELSLCQTLEALRMSEDTDGLETVTYLKTAARCLPAVEMESGLKYGEVLNYCLFGLCAVGMTLDNELFQAEVCQTVISPLVENPRDFDGRR
ncbi:hypothetical protein HK57_00015 [Aspergillus ustus]|uniref:DUF7580 domain-containing protein n=1 Tax=Aspergillus ustus TaxID=40382 RepID=A0A0C1BVE0_ASPUT|nr:hypothetical protein HK57_00015 [Aspergillus ustus]